MIEVEDVEDKDDKVLAVVVDETVLLKHKMLQLCVTSLCLVRED